jgi:hypothetical protein
MRHSKSLSKYLISEKERGMKFSCLDTEPVKSILRAGKFFVRGFFPPDLRYAPIKELLRHNDIRTTLRYAHVSDKTKRERYEQCLTL